MKTRGIILLMLLATLAICVVLPMAGAVWNGAPMEQYLEFPPRTRYVEHAPFSWPIFGGLLTLEGIFLYIPLALILWRTREKNCPSGNASRPFPWWGWAGLVLGIVAWVLAWNRFPWFARWQRHTFTPLWIAYILVVNAWRYRRTGHCMITTRPLYFVALFPVSAVFWWLFEYLNRFVQNWYYVNVGDVSAQEYFWLATLPFSTVLPAVLGTYELLNSFLGEAPLVLPRGERAARRWRLLAVMAVIATVGLLMVGAYPDFFFPLLWIAPLLVLAVLMEWAGEDSLIFHSFSPENLRRLAMLALAALICGFFWEMWNYRSFCKWIYAVPFVNRFHLFEMPILGYAGYLPFGWECGLVGLAVHRLIQGNDNTAEPE